MRKLGKSPGRLCDMVGWGGEGRGKRVKECTVEAEEKPFWVEGV